jgi:thymidylate kinase
MTDIAVNADIALKPVPDTLPRVVPEGTLGRVLELCDELWRAGVRYCHWKSNDMLHRSASGENDLDLLVHRADGQRFAEVLARLGFRHAAAPGGRDHPGVTHHYALDPESGRFVHIHAHFLLVLGDDTTKNFRLPVEGPYLESCRFGEIFPVPAPEFELAVFVVRMILKHATWDAVAIGKGGLGSNERRELTWLLERADPVLTRAIVREHLGGIGEDLWERCLAAVSEDDHVFHRMAVGRELIRALQPHARRPRLHDASLRALRRVTWGSRRYLLRRPVRKRLTRAGATVAIVGGDGAGKSTAVEGTARWLGGPLLVHRTHLGKPRPSLLTLAVKGPMYVGRRVGLLPSTKATVDPRTATSEDFPGNAWALWHLLTARDRLRDYRRARRVADSGGIVVSDRWPLPQIRLMDGPRTSWVLDAPGRHGRLTLMLARAERRIYAQIAPPDVLVVLRIDPEIAVRRRSDEESTYVRARNTEVYGVDWSATNAVVVDAAQPPEAVLAQIRETVWDRL